MPTESAPHRIALEGELSIFTAAAVREQLLAALSIAKEIEVDLSQITEVDSAGLQVLIAAKREAAAMNVSLQYIGHSAAVLDALELTWLATYFGDPVLIPTRH